MQGWWEIKLFIERVTSVSMDALHVIAGVLLWVLFARLLRTSLTSWRPCLPVLALALANEWLDIRLDIWPHPGMQYGESVKDVVLTMIVPAVLTACLQRRPALGVATVQPAETEAALER